MSYTVKKVIKSAVALLLIAGVIFALFLWKNAGADSYADKYDKVDLSADVGDISRENTYAAYLAAHQEGIYPDTEVRLDLASAQGDSGVKLCSYQGEEAVLMTEEKSKVTFSVQIPQTGWYCILFDYCPVKSRGINAERSILINGETPFRGADTQSFCRFWTDEPSEIGKKDNQGNEIRPTQIEVFQWQKQYAEDSNSGYETQPYRFWFEKGENTVSISAATEPLALRDIRLVPVPNTEDYAAYLASHEAVDIVAALGHDLSYTDNGDDHTVACSRCDYSATEAHTYIDGTCVCGATETPRDPNLAFTSVSLSLKDCIQFTFPVRTSVLASYDSYYVTFRGYNFDGDLVEINDPGVALSPTYHRFAYNVWAMILNRDVSATLYGVKDGVVYEGQTITKSVRSYIEEKFSASTAGMKTVYANMLQYGAMAQINYGYDTEHLATSNLSAEILSYITTSVPTTVNQTSSTSNGLNGVTLFRNAVGTRDAVLLQFVLDIGSYTKEQIYAVATWTNYDGTPVTKTYQGSTLTGSGRRYSVSVDGLNAVCGKQPVNVTVYSVETGEPISETFTCSIQSQVYARQTTSNTTEAAINTLNMMNALMNYYNACEVQYG